MPLHNVGQFESAFPFHTSFNLSFLQPPNIFQLSPIPSTHLFITASFMGSPDSSVSSATTDRLKGNGHSDKKLWLTDLLCWRCMSLPCLPPERSVWPGRGIDLNVRPLFPSPCWGRWGSVWLVDRVDWSVPCKFWNGSLNVVSGSEEDAEDLWFTRQNKREKEV